MITRNELFGVCSVVALVVFIPSPSVFGQAGMRESLERLDRNENGYIDPDEITAQARPFLERLLEVRSGGPRIDLDRPNEISVIQDVSRRYFLSRSGGDRRRWTPPSDEGEYTVPTFEPKRFDPLVPQFGLPVVKFRYSQDDLDFADRTMRSHDENKDGFIDRYEASRHEWTHRNPFDDDLDQDARLSRLEMAQRYARRRMLDQGAGELRKKVWRDRGLIPRKKEEEQRREDDSMWWRRGGSDYWLTAALLSRFDSDKSSKLSSDEVSDLGLPIDQIDVDFDGEITRDELFAYIKQGQTLAGGSAESPPEWFAEKDANGDSQVEMHEFTDDWTAEKVREFEIWDANEDGTITVAESRREISTQGQTFVSSNAEILPPRKTIVSEIEVSEDFVVADLDVQLSISHTYASYLDIYLTGPDGTRVELCTAVGGSDDHFDNTILDDQSEESIAKGRPPFTGRFQPEGLAKDKPGLAVFNDQSVKGVWQLVVRGSRSERIGMLHEWKLIATPKN